MGLKGTRRRWLMVGFAALATVSLLGAACGDDDDDDDTPTATATTPATGTGTATGTTTSTATTTATENMGGDVDYGSLSGSIDIEGSSTVFPITEAAAEEFRSVASRVQVTVGGGGTGAGFDKFCRGESQISDASRPIEDDETTECAAAGIDDIVEVQVGIDALTVVVNPNNDWAQCMTVDQLNLAFKDGGAQTWADINPEWPDEEIEFYYPGADSGTFDYFLEAIGLEGAEEEQPSHRSDGTPSEDDNLLVRGVEGDQYAIGYFGFAYYQEAGQELNAVSVDNGSGCVEPSFDAALDGSYEPLSRPLFMYTSEAIMDEMPQVAAFINFVLENSEEVVAGVGYITMPDDILDEQFAKVSPYLP